MVCEHHTDDKVSGIYVDDDARWPKHFRNMGIRIEDSVAVGATSPYILTKEAVKEVSCVHDYGKR